MIRGGVDNEADTVADFMDSAAITAGPDWPLDHLYQIFRRMGDAASICPTGELTLVPQVYVG